MGELVLALYSPGVILGNLVGIVMILLNRPQGDRTSEGRSRPGVRWTGVT